MLTCTPSALVVLDRTRITPAQRVDPSTSTTTTSSLFELQEPEAELMLTAGLDFDMQALQKSASPSTSSLGQGALLHQARVTSHTPLALSVCVQAAQCVPAQTFNRL